MPCRGEGVTTINIAGASLPVVYEWLHCVPPKSAIAGAYLPVVDKLVALCATKICHRWCLPAKFDKLVALLCCLEVLDFVS